MDRHEYDPDTRRALRLFVALARCTNAVTHVAFEDIAKSGLKPSEFAVMELLYHKGPSPLGLVAERVLLTTASITYVVDQLEKKGFVRRVPCPNDRRVLYAALTDAGQEKIAAIFPAHAQCIREALSGLSAEDQEQATELLKKLGFSAASKAGEK